MAFHANWDEKRKRWVKPRGVLSRTSSAIDNIFGFHADNFVDVEDVREFLKKNVDIEKNKDSPVRIISIRSKNPNFGFDILTDVYNVSDLIVRRSDAVRFKEQADFLRIRLQFITNVDHREALAQLLSEYEKRYLLTQSSLNYSFRIVDAPVIATRPITPRPFLILLLAPVFGFIIGFTISAVLYARLLAKLENAS